MNKLTVPLLFGIPLLAVGAALMLFTAFEMLKILLLSPVSVGIVGVWLVFAWLIFGKTTFNAEQPLERAVLQASAMVFLMASPALLVGIIGMAVSGHSLLDSVASSVLVTVFIVFAWWIYRIGGGSINPIWRKAVQHDDY